MEFDLMEEEINYHFPVYLKVSNISNLSRLILHSSVLILHNSVFYLNTFTFQSTIESFGREDDVKKNVIAKCGEMTDGLKKLRQKKNDKRKVKDTERQVLRIYRK